MLPGLGPELELVPGLSYVGCVSSCGLWLECVGVVVSCVVEAVAWNMMWIEMCVPSSSVCMCSWVVLGMAMSWLMVASPVMEVCVLFCSWVGFCGAMWMW